MKRKLLIVALALGTVGGYAAGFAKMHRMAHLRWERAAGCGSERSACAWSARAKADDRRGHGCAGDRSPSSEK